MPKLKTKKTLLRRIKITKKGKMIRNKVGLNHLKVKVGTNQNFRHGKQAQITTKGYRKKFKRLLGKASSKLI